MGISFSEPKLDLSAMRAWKDQVIDRMADGLLTLAKQRGILLIQAVARFDSSNSVRLEGAEISRVRFKHGNYRHRLKTA